ncbi:MAG: acyl-CoA thioesterase [Candidatus Accumulibacter sp.]|jgi:acyl-CoA thioester hydrolase|nr:acyl-CoA thioesterase [Accumulibacter sp.]
MEEARGKAAAVLEAQAEVEVPFHDIDPMNVAWHGHYLKYFELARCELLRHFDYDYPKMRASGTLWPIVECHLKFIRPAVYGQRLRIGARLLEYENRIKIAYEIRDAQTGERLTKGTTVQVAVDAASGELLFVSPPAVFERLREAGAI